MKYTLSKLRFKDSEQSTRPVEGELLSITLHSPAFEFRSSPGTTAVMEDDHYFTFIEDNNRVRRFLKAGVLWVDYEFDGEMRTDDFVK